MGLLSHKNWDKFEPKDLKLITTTLTTPTAHWLFLLHVYVTHTQKKLLN